AREVTRPDQVTNRQIDAADFLALRRAQHLFVTELTVLAIDAIRTAGRLVEERAVGRLRAEVDIRESPTVMREQKRLVMPAVALDAGRGSQECRIRTSVEEARLGELRQRVIARWRRRGRRPGYGRRSGVRAVRRRSAIAWKVQPHGGHDTGEGSDAK